MKYENIFVTDVAESNKVIKTAKAVEFAKQKAAGKSDEEAAKKAGGDWLVGSRARWQHAFNGVVNGGSAVVAAVAGNHGEAALALSKTVDNITAIGGQVKNAVGTKIDQGLAALGHNTLDNQIAKHMDTLNNDKKFAAYLTAEDGNGKRIFDIIGKNGKVTHEELVTSLKTHFKIKSDGLIFDNSDEKLLKKLDLNGDGALSQGELLAGMNQVMKEERIAGAKQKVTDDKALQAQIQKHLPSLNKDKQLIAVSNNNGAKIFNTDKNQKAISVEEISKKLAEHGITRIDQLDTGEKDGVISQKELMAALQKIIDQEREEGLKQKKKDDAYKADLAELLKKDLVEELKKKKITVNVKEYDSNGDGKLDLKDQDKIMAVIKEKGIDLEKIDKDQDTNIELEELGAAMKSPAATPKTPTTVAKKTADSLSKS